MGIGWKGGYFGIQEHASPADRYVLFSVWDGAEPVEVRATAVRGDERRARGRRP